MLHDRNPEKLTCIFGLQVEESSKGETLHFTWRQNIIPAEKNTVCITVWYFKKSLTVTTKHPSVFLSPVPVHRLIQATCALQETGLQHRKSSDSESVDVHIQNYQAKYSHNYLIQFYCRIKSLTTPASSRNCIILSSSTDPEKQTEPVFSVIAGHSSSTEL